MDYLDQLRDQAREAFQEAVTVLTEGSSAALKTQAVDDALAAVAAYALQVHITEPPKETCPLAPEGGCPIPGPHPSPPLGRHHYRICLR